MNKITTMAAGALMLALAGCASGGSSPAVQKLQPGRRQPVL